MTHKICQFCLAELISRLCALLMGAHETPQHRLGPGGASIQHDLRGYMAAIAQQAAVVGFPQYANMPWHSEHVNREGGPACRVMDRNVCRRRSRRTGGSCDTLRGRLEARP